MNLWRATWPALALSLVVWGDAVSQVGAAPFHIADSNDRAKVIQGKELYARWCASCHG